jgi:hypothetical protein
LKGPHSEIQEKIIKVNLEGLEALTMVDFKAFLVHVGRGLRGSSKIVAIG